MSHKTEVIRLHEEGKDYNEIEKETGAKRSYIRTIISQYKKANDSIKKETEDVNEENKEEIKDDAEEMDFEDDLSGMDKKFSDKMGDKKFGDKMGDKKTGEEYHKAWVEAKDFECACGCTLNRKSTFCPNCGTTLDWSGF